MELSPSNYITIISVVVLVVGWFVNSWLNRRHEVFKKRVEYQVEMYMAWIDASFTLVEINNDKIEESKRKELVRKYIEKLEHAQKKIILFGETEQINMVETVVRLAQANEHLALVEMTTQLNLSIRNLLRKELGLRKI